MPNIAGVYEPRGDARLIESLLARMARVIDDAGAPCACRRMVAPGAGCVSLLSDAVARLREPLAVDEGAGLWLMLDGELYNGAELRRHLARLGEAGAPDSDAALCLALFRREGESFVDRLNGQFNLVLHRAAEGELLIANDRYGYRPLFVSEYAPRLLFALEMKAVLAALDAPAAIDGVGLLQFLREGIAIGSRTWLERVEVLDAGTVLTATREGVRRRRYFRFRYREGRAPMSLPAFVEGFGVKLHRATERLMARGGRIGIALSGGLDSRSVALAIHPSYLPIPAYTFGYPESRDVVYARQLAALLGLRHTHLALEPGYLDRVLVPVVWRTEGLLPFTSTTSLFFHRRIGAAMDVILTGHCGDALTGSHIRPFMMATRSRERLIDAFFTGRAVVRDDDLRRVLNPAFYAHYAPLLREATAESFRGIDNDEIANVADAWDMENRQHRGTFHSPSVDRYRFEARTPFLDNELVDHLLLAPPRWRFQQHAYKRMILYAFPHAAHVPWAYTGHPLTASAAVELARIGWNYGYKRMRAVVSRRTGRAYIGEDFRDLAAELRAERGVAQRLLAFAAAESFPSHVFDRHGIEEAVARHWERGEDLTDLVCALATVAVAYELFVAQPPTAMPPQADPAVAWQAAESGPAVGRARAGDHRA